MHLRTVVTKEFSICYGHHLPDYNGKCCNFHGHNSVVRVSVTGPISPGTGLGQAYAGMVMDFGSIKSHVSPLLEKLDHKDLNDVLPEEYQPPTAENISRYLFMYLDEVFREMLVSVEVSETPTSWAKTERRVL